MSENLNFKVKRIFKINKTGAMRAFVDLAVNDEIIIRGLRVVEGKRGAFVSMPQEKGKDGKWYDTIRCLTRETRNDIAQCVLEVYEKEK